MSLMNLTKLMNLMNLTNLTNLMNLMNILTVKAGWGDWAGPGNTGISPAAVKRRDKAVQRVIGESEAMRKARKDSKLLNVIISEDRIKTDSKYKISKIPHPFTSREEYERSLQMPVGAEWNASHVVRENTKPEIYVRAGRLIEPIKLPKGSAKK